jgi:hydroxymethylglutaryl-CoA lyase
MDKLKLIECPRDAMQGMETFVPTQLKTDYINMLLGCGFDTIDFGSFVSPKAIPQMRDTAEVLKGLNLNDNTKLLAIIANERGAEDALSFEEIDYLGYPFSVSEVFQMRNTNSSIEQSLSRVERIQELVQSKRKKLVVYLSMGFGNPYDETWSPELVLNWARVLHEKIGIEILAPSDTIGCATPDVVSGLFETLLKELKEVEFGAHLHARKENATVLLDAAYSVGCRRFDSAIRGFGGCPMAKDDLTGNIATEDVLRHFKGKFIETHISEENFENAFNFSSRIFNV